MHLFLCGESGAGKSGALERALQSLRLAPLGFSTRRQTSEAFNLVPTSAFSVSSALGSGFGCGPAFDPVSTPGPVVYIGRKMKKEARLSRMEEAAARIESAPPGALVLLDGLDFTQKEAARLYKAALAALERPCRVIGLCRSEDSPFMHKARQMDGVRVAHMVRHTRGEGYRILRDFLRPRTLAEALGVGIGMTAFVGGGGKTSLIGRLGRDLAAEGDRVALSTTTHVSAQSSFYMTQSPAELEAAFAAGHNPAWITGPLPEGHPEADVKRRAPEAAMDAVLALSDALLVEADGSKGLPFKAHAPYEPALPEGARVIAVVGADAFGRPIGDVVHRAPLLCKAWGVKETDILTGELAARAAFRADTVLVNKVENPEALREARAFARARPHKRTVLASLQSAQPVIEIWEGELCIW